MYIQNPNLEPENTNVVEAILSGILPSVLPFLQLRLFIVISHTYLILNHYHKHVYIHLNYCRNP